MMDTPHPRPDLPDVDAPDPTRVEARWTRIRGVLEAETRPAILLSPAYQILASNDAYREAFGGQVEGRRCFEVSHGYDAPCDLRGEHCPLAQARATRAPARVLHVHRTPRGPEHVDVFLKPVLDDDGTVLAFLEVLRSVDVARATAVAGAQVGRSKAFTAALELAVRAAPTDVPVLLLGESGTGKERLARTLHDASARAEGPFVAVACSGLSESLFESELFGHEKGAFTGAHSRKFGLVETAQGGTLFLDEIGDVPPTLQVKLLRLLESRQFRRVGGTEHIAADFRLVCATWRDLDALLVEGHFRPDLYFRISAFPIRLPALRERRDDIPMLAESMLRELGAPQRIAPTALQRLQHAPWPGNIRQLRNVLQRASILADGDQIEVAHLGLTPRAREPVEVGARLSDPARPEPSRWPWGDVVLPLDEVERRYLAWCAQRHPEDRAALARQLGISPRTLYRRLAKLQGTKT